MAPRFSEPTQTMKTPFVAACLASASFLSGAEPQNLIQNGDFQSGAGVAFHSTPPWYNRGTGLNQAVNARVDLGGGAYAATINDRYDAAAGKFGPTAHTQRTNHVIQAGDVFTLCYDWRPLDEYWQKRRDTVRFVLYATADDTIGGREVWSVSLTSDFFLGDIKVFKSVTQETAVVGAAAVGKKLMVTFHGLDTEDGVGGKPHYARVDNIVLTAGGKTGAAAK